MSNVARLYKKRGLDALVMSYVIDMKTPQLNPEQQGEWMARQHRMYKTIVEMAESKEAADKLVTEALEGIKLFGV